MPWSKDTEVSQSNPLIKQILAATIGSAKAGSLLKGKRIILREVPASWQHTEHIDDKTNAFYLNLDTLVATDQVRVHRPERPTYGGPAIIHPAPQLHEVLVQFWHLMGKKGVEIIVRDDAIDSSAVSIATDALLAKNKKGAAAALVNMGPMAGIGMAIAETDAKNLAKKERGETPKQKARAGRLERAVAVAVGRRGLPSTHHLTRGRSDEWNRGAQAGERAALEEGSAHGRVLVDFNLRDLRENLRREVRQGVAGEFDRGYVVGYERGSAHVRRR